MTDQISLQSLATEREYVKKVMLRLGPFLALLYAFCIIDRGNVAAAKPVMLPDLKFDDAIYGLGAGMFFIGYFLFEVPSNLFMEKVGARWWISRIMVTWGIVSAAMMFMRTPMQYYSLRFLLGVAEAGFFPGVILYFTYWIPATSRARAIAVFLAIQAFIGVLGAPLGALLLWMNGFGGLKGWQWLFLLEGVPSVLLGIVVFFVMPDKPANAGWLSAEEKVWIANRLEMEARNKQAVQHMSLLSGITPQRMRQLCGYFLLGFLTVMAAQPLIARLVGEAPVAYILAAPWRRILTYPAIGGVIALVGAQIDSRIRHMCLVMIVSSTAGNAVGFFQNALIQARSVNPITHKVWDASTVALILVFPAIVGAIAMVVAAGHSDRSGKRREHLLLGYLTAAIGYVACIYAPGAWPTIAALCLYTLGERIGAGSYWALTTNLLGARAAAGGIALINSVGNLGGFIGPTIMGWLMVKTKGDYSFGLWMAVSLMAISGILGWLMRGHPTHAAVADHEREPESVAPTGSG